MLGRDDDGTLGVIDRAGLGRIAGLGRRNRRGRPDHRRIAAGQLGKIAQCQGVEVGVGGHGWLHRLVGGDGVKNTRYIFRVKPFAVHFPRKGLSTASIFVLDLFYNQRSHRRTDRSDPMATTDLYGVQTFVRDGKGRLAQGVFVPCRDADEARRLAEARVAGGRAAGSAAFLRRGGGEFDEGEAITIAVFGAVPPEAADLLPF